MIINDFLRYNYPCYVNDISRYYSERNFCGTSDTSKTSASVTRLSSYLEWIVMSKKPSSTRFAVLLLAPMSVLHFQWAEKCAYNRKKVDFDDIVTILVPGGRLVMKLEIKKSNTWLQIKCFER